VVLNPDLVLEAGAIAELAATLRDPAVGVAVPMILDWAGRLELTLRREPSLSRAIGDAVFGHHLPHRPGWLSETVRDERAYRYRHSVDWAGGAAAIVSAACDAAVGPWDERFFLYSEEVDHAARVRAAGFRIEYVPTARIRHREGGSGSSAALTALLAVNRIRYVAKRGRGGGVFRAAVVLHELLRASDPAHRFALRTVLRRSRWSALPGGPGSSE
jgi:GT2 family glycosyltransferase